MKTRAILGKHTHRKYARREGVIVLHSAIE